MLKGRLAVIYCMTVSALALYPSQASAQTGSYRAGGVSSAAVANETDGSYRPSPRIARQSPVARSLATMTGSGKGADQPRTRPRPLFSRDFAMPDQDAAEAGYKAIVEMPPVNVLPGEDIAPTKAPDQKEFAALPPAQPVDAPQVAVTEASRAKADAKPGSPATDSEAPVNLEADEMAHDKDTQTVTASGHVVLEQEGRTVKADKIVYNTADDTVVATGNVMFRDANGDTHFMDEVELSNEMKDGFVSRLQTYLASGGKFTAETGTRTNATTTVMTRATFTPCECDVDSDGDPAWQLKAKKVIYHEDENRVSYRNAEMDIFGVPVLWTPYLSHPDGKVKQKSGVLPPTFGYDSELGAKTIQQYYWAIAPDKDATFGTMLTTQEAPVGMVQYRQRFAEGSLRLDASGTRSDRTDSVDGEDVVQRDDARGHLFGEGRWDINDKWRSGFDVQLASDDQYLRQYDFSNKDVLENDIYAERFSGRNYGVGRLLAFQDVRVREDQADQPAVLPEIYANFLGEPNDMLGGRWDATVSALGIARDGSGQDVRRASLEGGWERQFVTDLGLVTKADLNLRGDVYQVDDQERQEDYGSEDNGSAARVFPQAHLVGSYPLVKPMERAQMLIEPTVALTAVTNVEVDESEIPNEDSQDIQLDASNLFEPSRFPGFDRVEDRTHLTYGVRTGLFGYEGSYGDIFLGQSYRFNQNDNPFPEGSGLDARSSDYVGEITANYNNDFILNYRFQLDSGTLSPQRHEFDGYASWNRFSINTRYLYAQALEGTNLDDTREQIENDLGIQVTDKWRVRTGLLNDLGEEAGLREATLAVQYSGCCMMMELAAERNLTSDSSGDAGIDVMLRLGLKGIGEF